MVATLLLVALLAVAAATDLRRQKIYNWTTYPGILAAWVGNALGELLAAGGIADHGTLASLGWVGLGASFAGFLVCGLVLLVCYVLFKVGGGDVKLMAMIGAFLGVGAGIKAMLWAFVLGGCVGLIVLVWRVGPLRLARAAMRHLVWTIRLGQASPLTPDERAFLKPPLHLAPSALAATVMVQFSLVERLSGTAVF